VSSHRLSHTHTHRRLDAYFQVLKHRLSLSHIIVTSMLISRCQTIISLSLSQNCHLDAYFQVSNHRLSLSQNCHPDAYFQVSNHPLSLSHTQSSPRRLFPVVKPLSLFPRGRHLDAYFQVPNHRLSLSHRDRDVDFLPAHTNKQSAGNANALCVAVAP
jgi:hypothetical protein